MAVRHSASFEIQQAVKGFFPLFSAEGERLWVSGWDYENIMGSSALRENYVFVTKSRDHASTEAIWLVKRYIPYEHSEQFYKVEPGEKVGIIEVKCVEQADCIMNVQVTYEYIGLSTSGNRFVASLAWSEYEAFIAKWKALLESYFESRR